MNRSSFTSANAWPAKVFRDTGLLRHIVETGQILPRHVQIALTNRCNLRCPWCSCSERTLRDELSVDDLKELVPMLSNLGTQAITITGGGEPTLHPWIDQFVHDCWVHQIAMGLVTNGIDLRKHMIQASVRDLTWCRVSFSDTRTWDRAFEASLGYLREWPIDLAFSYVLTDQLNRDNLLRVVEHAERQRFTHVRVVSDILAPNAVTLSQARELVGEHPLVILQDRAEHTAGAARCLISLLKPVLAPDGYVQPCCGTQYAIGAGARTFPQEMRMCHWRELPQVIAQQRHFDGSACERCFYSGYNEALAALTAPLDHLAFV